ncbi:MAG: hypothetical protein PF693_20400 [Spirochaetia bacterium]|nr:hypothetical protein [Spirochaetia bacterium]
MRTKVITGSIIFLLLISLFLISGCDDFSLIEILSNDISLIPGEVTLNFNESIKFEVSAGVSPFVFTESGDGAISGNVFTAPGTSGSFPIMVEDNLRRTAEATITVVDPATQVYITPEIVSTVIDGVISFTISGGTGPYTVIWDSILGEYDTTTDEYTALTAGADTIMVTDSLLQTAEAYVNITNNTDLMISPQIVELLLGETVQFSASGGSTTYTYSHFSGDGSFSPATRIYTAPAVLGSPTALIRVDDTGTTEDATIYIVANPFTINPSLAITLNVSDEFTFSASNGNPPYTFSILDNESSGSINSATGLFTALIKDNNVTVVVEDSRGTMSTCRVKIKD